MAMTSIDSFVALYSKVIGERLGYVVETRLDLPGLQFRHEAGDMLIICHEDDPEFLNLILPNFHSAAGLSRGTVETICHKVTSHAKAAKLLAGDDGDLSVSVEMLVAPTGCLPTPHHLASILPRAINMAISAGCSAVQEAELSGIAVASGETP
jgi:hypothetical protein